MTSGDNVSVESGHTVVIAGRYALQARLGAGGMGTVWRAHDQVLKREVAIKEVHTPSGLDASAIERMYTRLEREAWAAARVSHRNVVTVYDVAMEGGRPWVVMELVQGQSLADLLDADGPLNASRAAAIGVEVLAALRAAHEVGVLHRDVKPANVLIAQDGRVVLTDFGIAVIEGSAALTMVGEVVGSPEFLAPERALGKRPGLASDLWSLGVLLYMAVEGSSPFRKDAPLNTLRAIVDAELPPTRRAGPLTPILEGLLRKDPETRLGAEQAALELQRVGQGGPPRTGAGQQAHHSPTVINGAQVQCTPQASPTRHEMLTPVTHPTASQISSQPTATLHPAPTTLAHPVPLDSIQSRSQLPSASGRFRQYWRTSALAAAALCALTATLHTFADGKGEQPQGTARTAADDDPVPSGAKGSSSDAGEAETSGATNDRQDDSSVSEGVRMRVTGAQTTYAGQCPPQEGEAPIVTATFTVDRLPAHFSYRWVSKDGSVTDEQWRTLSFPKDGSLSKQVHVSLTTWARAGTLKSEIGVELHAPLRGKSNTIPISLTCTVNPPTSAS